MAVYEHTTVLLHEAVDLLACESGKTYVDGTLGGAGHARLICEQIAPNGRLICIDNDPAAIENAKVALADFANMVSFHNCNYDELPKILAELNITGIDGAILDLGLSFNQLANSQRGFSFSKDEPLDMRMNPNNGTTAYEIVNKAKENELADIFFQLGEERFSRQIARRIVEKRAEKPLESSLELAALVSSVIRAKLRNREKIHPATRVFMALRIYVNAEFTHLTNFLSVADSFLNLGGRLSVISFHSLEDRIVKHSFREMAQGCICDKHVLYCMCGRTPKFEVLTRKAIRPDTAETERNHMARSACLRGLRKIK